MTVEDYYVDGKRIPVSEINLSDPNQRRLLNFSILCNDSSNANGQEIGDPTETALINLGSRLGREAFEVRDVYDRKSEIPFDSDRKLMSTAHVFSGRHVMVVKGAVDVLLTRMTHIRRGETVEPMTAERKAEIEAQNLEFSRDACGCLHLHIKRLKKIGNHAGR